MTREGLELGLELRGALIVRRDKALEDADFSAAVELSHIIAWMAEAMGAISRSLKEKPQ